MKIYRFSIFLLFITVMALLYVHQQVRLLKMSYKINSNEGKFTRLLDQNRSLVYNINQLKSPVCLEKRFLAAKNDFAIHRKWQLVEVAAKKEDRQPLSIAKKEPASFISRIFGRPREAMANPVKQKR